MITKEKKTESFQEYLKSIGYTPFRYEIVNGEFIEIPTKNEGFFSTMGAVNIVYKRGDSRITYGLNEYGFPPTIIYPQFITFTYSLN